VYYLISVESIVHTDDDATNAIDVNEPYVSLNDGNARRLRTTYANVPPTEITTIRQELSERTRGLETIVTIATEVIIKKPFL
jgi:hypothetical protein